MSRTDVLRASPPMFESRLLDALSRVHPAVPILIFLPGRSCCCSPGAFARRACPSTLGLFGGRLRAVDAVRVLAAPARLPLRARGRPRRAHALDHPRRPPRPPERPAAPGDAARREHPAGRVVFGADLPDLRRTLRARPRRGLLRRLPGVRHDALLPAPLPPARTPRRGCSASATCATTSRTTPRASGSARPTGTRSSAPPPRGQTAAVRAMSGIPRTVAGAARTCARGRGV